MQKYGWKKMFIVRLAALQKSGENWKRRVEPQRHLVLGQRPKSFIAGESRTPNASDVVHRMKLTPGSGVRPESIADRLSLLTGSQDSWKSKVAEKDTNMFTVEGKMSRHGICSNFLSSSDIYGCLLQLSV